MEFFMQSRKSMGLKFTEELCVMTMKNDAKYEEELTFRLKFVTTTWQSIQMSQKFAL